MARFDVVTIGSVVQDITFYTGAGKVIATPDNLTSQRMLAFEYGAKISASEAFYSLGGGGANTAVSLSRLGMSAASFARVGSDEIGKELVAKFKREKVNVSLIQKDKKNNSGFSFVVATDKKEKEHVVFTCRGANEHLEISKKEISKLKTKWVYITSLSGKNWLLNLKTLFAKVKSSNIKVMWNPGSIQLAAGKRVLQPFLEQTDILTFNKDEAIELVLSGMKLGRKNPNHLNRPVYLLNILREWGPKIVVITEGKKGAWAYDGNKMYRQNSIGKKTVDTTGVGDAFGSAFLAGYAETGLINEALRWGATNSGSVISKIGAQNGLLYKKELK